MLCCYVSSWIAVFSLVQCWSCIWEYLKPHNWVQTRKAKNSDSKSVCDTWESVEVVMVTVGLSFNEKAQVRWSFPQII